MSATAPLLSAVVPAHNSQDYLDRALTTLVDHNGKAEVLTVDDGLKDDTARMADEWALYYPGIIRATHQENEGHGDAVSTGIRAANGIHMRVCDSDDWVGRPAMNRLLDLLREERATGRDLDLTATNRVYKKQGKTYKTVVRYRNVLLQGKMIIWEEVKPYRYGQYMMMHSLIIYTEVLCRFGLTLPEHTFYVDYLYSHISLPLVHTIRCLDVDLYRHFIGRDDQSVNEKVMISCLDQFLRVNHEMVAAMSKPEEVLANLYCYMAHYLHINCVVTTVMAQLSGTPEHLEMKDQMWNELEATGPAADATVESDPLTRLVCSCSRRFATAAYPLVRAVMGFNRKLTGLGFHFITTTGHTLKEPSWRIGKTQGKSGSSDGPR